MIVSTIRSDAIVEGRLEDLLAQLPDHSTRHSRKHTAAKITARPTSAPPTVVRRRLHTSTLGTVSIVSIPGRARGGISARLVLPTQLQHATHLCVSAGLRSVNACTRGPTTFARCDARASCSKTATAAHFGRVVVHLRAKLSPALHEYPHLPSRDRNERDLSPLAPLAEVFERTQSNQCLYRSVGEKCTEVPDIRVDFGLDADAATDLFARAPSKSAILETALAASAYARKWLRSLRPRRAPELKS